MASAGAMAAIGAGLTTFGNLIGEKRASDEKFRNDQLQHQRALNLEALRAKNNKELSQQKRDWRVEDIQSQRDYNRGVLEDNREYALKQKGLDREARDQEFMWRLTKSRESNIQNMEDSVSIKKQTYERAVAEGVIQDSPEARASYIFDIKAPKGVKPSATAMEIAERIVMMSAPEGAGREDLMNTIRVTAIGLEVNPQKTMKKLGVGGEGGTQPKFNKASDVTKMKSLAKKAKGGDEKATETLAEALSIAKSQLSDKEYSSLVSELDGVSVKEPAAKSYDDPDTDQVEGPGSGFLEKIRAQFRMPDSAPAKRYLQ